MTIAILVVIGLLMLMILRQHFAIDALKTRLDQTVWRVEAEAAARGKLRRTITAKLHKTRSRLFRLESQIKPKS